MARDSLSVAEAGALLESLAVNHPFVDGNKRIAFSAADVFLRINGAWVWGTSSSGSRKRRQLGSPAVRRDQPAVSVEAHAGDMDAHPDHPAIRKSGRLIVVAFTQAKRAARGLRTATHFIFIAY